MVTREGLLRLPKKGKRERGEGGRGPQSEGGECDGGEEKVPNIIPW